MKAVRLIECPRDAMQGMHDFIPTDHKVAYVNKLLRVGFSRIDVGSFVSPKAIPQMRDSGEVIRALDLSDTASKLSVIIANRRGAHDAVNYDEVDMLGYPFSISETFQRRNTNSSIEESLQRVADIQAIALKYEKELLIYVSMAFGNPYGDPWNVEIAYDFIQQLISMGITRFSLSDTIGVSSPDSISYLFSNLIPHFPDIVFNAHLHTTPDKWEEKVSAAYASGCRSFDGAIKGYGGCPMATDKLTGNMPSEKMVAYFQREGIPCGVDNQRFREAINASSKLFL